MSSPNKQRYVVRTKHADALEGLIFFTSKNSKGSWIIPTTKNFIAGYQVKKIKCDDGATCSIFPLCDTATLREVILKNRAECHISVISLQSVGGFILGLTVQHIFDKGKFDIQLGLDIYPTANVSQNLESELASASERAAIDEVITTANAKKFDAIASVCALNYFLCSEDVQYLLCAENADLLDAVVVGRELLVPYVQMVPRRTSALLGSDFLGGYGGISFDKAKFYFDPTRHKLEACNWIVFAEIVQSIRAMKYLQTADVDFNDLNSIEPNDIFGIVADEEELNPYDDNTYEV